MILVGLLAFVFCLVLTFVRYIELYYTFGLLDCVCYNKDFVILRFIISRFFPIQFTVTLVELKSIGCYAVDFVMKSIVRYAVDFVMKRFV